MKITKRKLKKIVEQAIQGPGLDQGKDFATGGSGKGKAAAMASYDEMYYDLMDDYYAWVEENGHITPSASSVMASYFLEKNLEDDHKRHKMLSKAFKVDHSDIMADIRRQKAERSSLKESIRRMIKEAMSDEPIRMIPGDSLDAEMMKQSRSKKTKKTTSSDFRDTIVMSPAGDSVLVGGQETSPDNVEGALEALSGQMLGYGDAAKLENLLKKQMAAGYVEIPISWSPNMGWRF